MGEFVDISKRTVLSMTGQDCLDFLQRISTNNVLSVGPGQPVQTVLTNEKGRIVDVVTVVKKTDAEVLVLGESETSGLLQSWIEKYIIMEDIRHEDVTDKYVQFLAYGSEATSRGALIENVPDGFLIVEEVRRDCRMLRVVVAATLKGSAELELSQLGYQLASSERFDEFRIRHGVPAFPNELSVSYNPLEAGLGHLISWTKGCYIGQEVIARLNTYKKVQRTLVGLRMSELPQAFPAPILSADSECGTITSARKASGKEECIGLGYLKTGMEPSGSACFFVSGGIKIPVGVER